VTSRRPHISARNYAINSAGDRAALTPPGSYGTLQKTSYLVLIFVFGPLMTLTGIAQSPGVTAAMPWLLECSPAARRRGRCTIGTVMLVLFVIVHVLEVVAAGSSAGSAR
jgi:thiosulfate reductase cytochrome b subunit